MYKFSRIFFFSFRKEERRERKQKQLSSSIERFRELRQLGSKKLEGKKWRQFLKFVLEKRLSFGGGTYDIGAVNTCVGSPVPHRDGSFYHVMRPTLPVLVIQYALQMIYG